MFEFRWSLPSPTATGEIRLQIHARNGWIGRKVLLLDGRQLYRRRWFGGIDYNFPHPDQEDKILRLRAREDRRTGAWHPELRCDGQVIPEATGATPPPVPDRPQVVSVVVGATYLAIFTMVVMMQHIPKMLTAVRGHSDMRGYVLEVTGPNGDSGELHQAAKPLRPGPSPEAPQPGYPRIETEALPAACEDQAYAADLRVVDGQPPFDWVVNTRKLPEGLKFTADAETDDTRGATARLGGTLADGTAGAYRLEFRVTDAVYSPGTDIWPWVVPFAATAFCLLGFWNMRLWSVPVYAALILAQVVLGLAFAWPPLSVTAVVLQVLVWGVGAVHWSRMH
ncbi:MAG TPA: hypothetical protein VM243_07295 [Phycisphaerae bacterium]|nr:hypothetical protein [Phycisphaerae bacterium]